MLGRGRLSRTRRLCAAAAVGLLATALAGCGTEREQQFSQHGRLRQQLVQETRAGYPPVAVWQTELVSSPGASSGGGEALVERGSFAGVSEPFEGLANVGDYRFVSRLLRCAGSCGQDGTLIARCSATYPVRAGRRTVVTVRFQSAHRCSIHVRSQACDRQPPCSRSC